MGKAYARANSSIRGIKKGFTAGLERCPRPGTPVPNIAFIAVMTLKRRMLEEVKATLARLGRELDALALFNASNEVVTARDPAREQEFAELRRLARRLERIEA